MNNCCPRLGQTVEKFVKPGRTVNVVFLHCTAASSPEVDAEMVNDWHLGNGWSCIGYHFLITTNGVIQHGRDIEQVPAAQSGYNTGSIAICLNGLNESDFSEVQFNALRWLCNEINAAYGGIRFRGHKEVAAKACPVFDYKKVLSLDADGYMSEDPDEYEGPESSTIPMVPVQANLAQLGFGDDHPHVQLVWSLLGVLNSGIRLFDETLEIKVVEFQRRQALTADGIVGKKTWERLLDVGDD